MTQSKKNVWIQPTVRVYGSIEQITSGCNKDFGGYDGFTFQSQQVICTS